MALQEPDVVGPTGRPDQSIKVILGKVGLDGHDRGVKVVARALRDAGMEVIYLGIRCTTNQLVRSAIQEDAAIIGVSNLSAALPAQCEEILAQLNESGASHIAVFAGGTVLPEDTAKMRELGVSDVFGPGSSTSEIVRSVRAIAAAARRREGVFGS